MNAVAQRATNTSVTRSAEPGPAYLQIITGGDGGAAHAGRQARQISAADGERIQSLVAHFTLLRGKRL